MSHYLYTIVWGCCDWALRVKTHGMLTGGSGKLYIGVKAYSFNIRTNFSWKYETKAALPSCDPTTVIPGKGPPKLRKGVRGSRNSK